MGQLIGYRRVSTVDQNAIRQLDGVELDKVFTDKASGKDINRPQRALPSSFCGMGTPWWCTAWTGWPGYWSTCAGLAGPRYSVHPVLEPGCV